MGKEKKVRIGRLGPQQTVRIINALGDRARSLENRANSNTEQYSPFSTAKMDRREAQKTRKLSDRVLRRLEKHFDRKKKRKRRSS